MTPELCVLPVPVCFRVRLYSMYSFSCGLIGVARASCSVVKGETQQSHLILSLVHLSHREQVARFIHERVTQLSSLQTPRVNKGAMREKRESPSLVAMRASGALLAMCERSPSRAHRDLESALATPTAPYLDLAGRSSRPTA